jgi:hypothetical protein
MSNRSPAWHRALALLLALVLPDVNLPARAQTTARDLTLDELQAACPGLRLHQVSAEEFARVTGHPLQVAQTIVAPETPAPRVTSGSLAPLATAPEPDATNATAAATNREPARVGPASAPRTRSSHTSSGGQIYISDSGSIDSTEAAVVIFVLAGVVVIAAAIVYSGALLANWALRGEEVPGWGDLSARWMYFSGGYQHGYLAGGALTLGLEGDGADVGAVVEGGYLDADMVTVEDTEVELDAGYVMAGLSVRWHLTPSDEPLLFEAELLAGTASRYDLVSRASFALTWSLAGPWRAGLRFGALYLDVAEDEGPLLQADNDFNLLGGLETSVRF